MPAFLRLFALALLLLIPSCAPFSPRHDSPPIERALWVKRWDFLTATDVRTAIDRAAALGCDTVFFQVRGNGTVFFPSDLEPWAEEFGHRDPGFDPLAVAVEHAHARGLTLHAWVNVVPGWRGANEPPAAIGQLRTTHRAWFLVDRDGALQPLHDEYVALNPCRPEARAHVVRVLEEIATGYDVDGIHLDYIRFLDDFTARGKEYPFDTQTLARYRAETGAAPDDDPAAWDRWRAGEVTAWVREIRAMLRRSAPRVRLTAAVFRTPEAAARVKQDWPRWAREGLVDAIVPMIYETDDARFAADLEACLAAAAEVPVIAGIGVYKQEDPQQFLRQMRAARRAGARGVSWFDYESFHDPGTPCPRGRLRPELQEPRRRALAESEDGR